MSKAVVLLSGGQDSTTCLFWAMHLFDEVEAIGIYYGQRHATELASAEQVASAAGVRFRRLEAPVLSALGDSDLVRTGTTIAGAGGAPDRFAPEGLPTSFVPGRNALFLVMAAAAAIQLGARNIVTGVCQTDYSGYPDCREEFVEAMELAVTLAMPSSAGPLRIYRPLMHLSKAETVRLARRLPGCWEALAMTITCYEGLRPGCGTCPACLLRAQGFAEAGLSDPAQ